MTIHSTAIIDEGARIGNGTRVWHWVHVCSGAEIGDNFSVGQNCYVGNDVVIGSNVKIQNNASFHNVASIEDDVFCGASMVFTNAYNPPSPVNRRSENRDTLAKRRATTRANSTIVCGVTIGEYALVGASAVITHDVPPYGLMGDVRARRDGAHIQGMGLGTSASGLTYHITENECRLA